MALTNCPVAESRCGWPASRVPSFGLRRDWADCRHIGGRCRPVLSGGRARHPVAFIDRDTAGPICASWDTDSPSTLVLRNVGDRMKGKPPAVRASGTHGGNTLEKVVESSTLEPLLLELVKLRASQINGCAYCVDMHAKDARAIGQDEQRLYLVAVWREAPFCRVMAVGREDRADHSDHATRVAVLVVGGLVVVAMRAGCAAHARGASRLVRRARLGDPRPH